MVTVLITGGTGFFGRNLVKYIVKQPGVKKIIIYSRSEHKQEKMAKDFDSPKLRFFIGDVRDIDRLRLAMRGVDRVIHAAALKVVPSCEYNPSEAVKTNVLGTDNVIRVCVECGAKRATLVSTDKAVEPVNLYGATKATAEKLWIAANSYAEIFDVVRFGNVMGSTGSVLKLWKESLDKDKTRPLEVTDAQCTRFFLKVFDAVRFAWDCEFKPGAISIPQMKAFQIIKLISALYKRAKWVETGLRQGEKIHETIISQNEWPHHKIHDYRTIRYYVIHKDINEKATPISITSSNSEKLNANDLIKELESL